MSEWIRNYSIDFSPNGDTQGEAIKKIEQELQSLYQKLNLIATRFEGQGDDDIVLGQIKSEGNTLRARIENKWKYLGNLSDKKPTDSNALGELGIEGKKLYYARKGVGIVGVPNQISEYTHSEVFAGTKRPDYVIKALAGNPRISMNMTRVGNCVQYNKLSGPAVDFEIGDKVLVSKTDGQDDFYVYVNPIDGCGGIWRGYLLYEGNQDGQNVYLYSSSGQQTNNVRGIFSSFYNGSASYGSYDNGHQTAKDSYKFGTGLVFFEHSSRFAEKAFTSVTVGLDGNVSVATSLDKNSSINNGYLMRFVVHPSNGTKKVYLVLERVG